MKCMNEKGLEAYQVKRNLKKLEQSLRNKFGVKMKVFRRWTVMDRSREIEEMREELRLEEYIDPSVMLNSWGIGRYQGSYRGRCWGTGRWQLRYRATKNQIQEQKLDQSTRCRRAIKEAGAFSIDPPSIEEVSRLRLRKKFEKLDR